MTLGGLVVALGVVVDDAVIDVENILRRRRNAPHDADVAALFTGASLEVRRPVFLRDCGGRRRVRADPDDDRHPGRIFPAAVGRVPACGRTFTARGDECDAGAVRADDGAPPAACGGWISGALQARAGAHDRSARAASARGLGDPDRQRHRPARFLLPLLGARLLPDFRENYLIAHAGLRPGISLEETARVGRNISKALAAIPGVKSVAEQIGRAENGQDPDTPDRSEFEVQIDPQRGNSAASIDSAIRGVFDNYPNQLVEIYSVLAERIGETLSGESAPFSISVFGADLDTDDRVAGAIADTLRKLPTAATCAWSCRRASRSCTSN
jgi:hypothetical protein